MNLDQDTQEIVDTLLQDHQRFHSELQLDSFITSREGRCHTWGMYKQALRELASRYETLQKLEFQRELILVDIDEMENTDFSNTYAAARANIHLKQKKWELKQLDSALPDRQREFKRFLEQAVATKAFIGELTPEKRQELDQSYWLHRLRLKLAIELKVNGEPGFWIYEILYTLPDSMRVPLESDLSNPSRLEAYYSNLQKQIESEDKPMRTSSLERLLG